MLNAGELEEKVGITAFTTLGKRVKCTIRSRLSDFVVRELQEDGSPVKYIADNSIALCKTKFEVKERDNIDTDVFPGIYMNLFNDIKRISNNKVDFIDDFESFVRGAIFKDSNCVPSIRPMKCNDKATRALIHEIFKKHVNLWIDSCTEIVDGIMYIKLYARHKMMETTDGLIRAREFWPSEGDYLEFTLIRENVAMMNALDILARTARCHPSSISYSGAKDNRGITFQKCTIHRRWPNEIAVLNKQLGIPSIRVGDFRLRKSPIQLGSSPGNEFQIVFRNIHMEHDDDVIRACEEINEFGFVNYFSLQRFGKEMASSYHIGALMFAKKYREAIDSYLQRSSESKPELTRCRHYFVDGKYKEAYDYLCASPSLSTSIESKIFSELYRNPKNYFRAFSIIPKSTRLYFMHSFQSYVWNLAVSERIRVYGLHIVEGDLVTTNISNIFGESKISIDSDNLTQMSTSDTTPISSSTNTHVETIPNDLLSEKNENNDKMSQNENTNFDQLKTTTHNDIHVITKRDVEEGRYSVKDVLLPLPGSNIKLPENHMKYFYEKILREFGLTLKDFGSGFIAYRSKGVYRKIIERPINFSWRIVSHTNPNIDIINTENRICPNNNCNNNNIVSSTIQMQDDNQEIMHKSLLVNFTLIRGSYASMFIRELTKTSADNLAVSTVEKDIE